MTDSFEKSMHNRMEKLLDELEDLFLKARSPWQVISLMREISVISQDCFIALYARPNVSKKAMWALDNEDKEHKHSAAEARVITQTYNTHRHSLQLLRENREKNKEE